MSVDVALEALRLQSEFENSVEVLESVYARDLEGVNYSFITERRSAKLICGIEGRGNSWHGDYPLDQIAPVTEILEDYLLGKPNGIKAEDYVLGLYMHDSTRDEDIVTALGKFLKEDNK